MSTMATLRHFRLALSRWPQETLRPDVSFSKIILAQKESMLVPPANQAHIDTQQSSGIAPEVDVKAELEQANALYSLLENRYSNKYKISKHLLEPQSVPTYYTDLMREIDEAPKRSWLGSRLNKWKGFLRFS